MYSWEVQRLRRPLTNLLGHKTHSLGVLKSDEDRKADDDLDYCEILWHYNNYNYDHDHEENVA